MTIENQRNGQPQQIISSLEGQAISRICNEKSTEDLQKAQQISKLLIHLAMTYFGRDYSPEQAKVIVADYSQDLMEFDIIDLEEAVHVYRKDPKSEFFPKPGRLYHLASVARKDRAERSKFKAGQKNSPEFGESRPLRWWNQPQKMWKSSWRERDIPAEEVKNWRLSLPAAELRIAEAQEKWINRHNSQG